MRMEAHKLSMYLASQVITVIKSIDSLCSVKLYGAVYRFSAKPTTIDWSDRDGFGIAR